MWCRSCQQDVPAVVAADEASRVCCPRCNSTLSSAAAIASRSSSSSTADPVADREDATGDTKNNVDHRESTAGGCNGVKPPPLNFDDWQLEDDVRTVQRVLRSLDRQPQLRFDPAHDEERKSNAPAPHVSSARAQQRTTAQSPRPPDRKLAKRGKSTGKSSWFSWLLMAMGLMTFVCGAVLLGWYFHDAQEHLWRLGLPLTLGGQVALLFGLLIQLEALWQNNRGTSVTLDDLDQQIDELRQTTCVMSNANSGAAKSFYVHAAEGASPDVLLADLKGQLDVLAVKMAKQR